MINGLWGIRLTAVWVFALSLCVPCGDLSRAWADQDEIEVPPTGDLTAALKMVPAGGRIVLKPGIHRPDSTLRIDSDGVSLVGEPGAELHAPKDLVADAFLTVDAAGVRIQGVVFDGKFADCQAIRSLRNSQNLRIEECEVRYWSKNGVELDGTDLVVSKCRIHHCLSTSDGKPDEVHGVVTTNAKGLRIEGCRISNCSGDSIQADRGSWQEIEIVDCDLFLEPLAESMRGFKKGDLVGGNAFDTKRDARFPLGIVLIENCRMWGFDRSNDDGAWAALYLRENVEVTVKGCSVDRSQVGCRMVAVRNGAALVCHIEDCKFTNCEAALRFEDFKEGSDTLTPDLTVENCHLGNCEKHLWFYNYRRTTGQGPWKPPTGVRISHCLFEPSIRLRLTTTDPKILRDARQNLLTDGENREQDPSDSTTEPSDRAGRDAPEPRTAKTSGKTAGGNGDDTANVCPRDDSHRGKMYRRAAGKLHYRCPTCGAIWTLPDPTAAPGKTNQNPTDSGTSPPPSPRSKPAEGGGKQPSPATKK